MIRCIVGAMLIQVWLEMEDLSRCLSILHESDQRDPEIYQLLVKGSKV